MADAGANVTPDWIPPLVPLWCVLDYLHDSDTAALTRHPLSGRRYDQKTLKRLFEQLVRRGVRARGNVDRAPETWIEPAELLDYQIGYMRVLIPGRGSVSIARLELYYTYSQVEDRGSPVHHKDAKEPRYRRIVSNVRVETRPLFVSGTLAETSDSDAGQNQRRKGGRKPQFDWDAIQAECNRRFNEDGFPDNVSKFCGPLLDWCQERFGEQGTRMCGRCAVMSTNGLRLGSALYRPKIEFRPIKANSVTTSCVSMRHLAPHAQHARHHAP